MYWTLLRLWITGPMTEQGLENAVQRNWITAEQKEEIMANDKN